MGNQCSCSNTKASLQHEIRPEKDIQAIDSTNFAKTSDLSQPQVQDGGLLSLPPPKIIPSLPQPIQKIDPIQQKMITSTKNLNIQKGCHKKRVQVLLPVKQIEQSNDQVNFIQKQISKEHLSLIVKTLKSHFILSQLSSQQILYVVTSLRYCTAEKNKYIFKQGDPSFSYYIILEGKCRVEINGQTKKYLENSKSFGDLGIVYNAPRSASIFTQTQCQFAQLNSKTFRKVINDINSNFERQNRAILQKMDFFKQLTEIQKNALASNCITQIYKTGEIIFNKGDDANALYIIQEGIVSVLEKKIDLKVGQNVGINAIMANNCTIRSNTLIAKTECKLLSLTRDIIIKNLGDSVQNVLQKNLLFKILKESDIWEMYSDQQWQQAVEASTLTKFNKDQIVFAKNVKVQPYILYAILSSDAKSKNNPKTDTYQANSLIQPLKTFKHELIVFQDDYICSIEAIVARIKLPKEKALAEANAMNVSGTFKKKESPHPSLITQQNLFLKDFVVVRRLRSGNFGKVYACYNNKTKSKYAIKVMNKESLISSNVMPYIMKEEELLRTLPPHPFLVKYSTMFKDNTFIMLVMQLLQGQDLFDAVNSRLPLSQSQIKFFISQLILVIQHLHSCKVVYRDLKPENIILNLDGYLTLVDMGTAKKLTIENRFKTMTIIGTPHYMAPEIILGKGYSFSVDWWSLGVMVYQMACGKLPYGEYIQDPFTVYQQILKSQLKFTHSTSPVVKQIALKLLNKNGHKRMKNGSIQLKQSTFFQDVNWQKLLIKEEEAKIFPSKTSLITQQQITQSMQKTRSTALQVFIKDKEREG